MDQQALQSFFIDESEYPRNVAVDNVIFGYHEKEPKVLLIGYELLEEEFTLSEIHSLYETILSKPLDDRNFTKKLLAVGIIAKLNEKRQISGHQPPFLCKFNKDKYDEGLKSGVELVF